MEIERAGDRQDAVSYENPFVEGLFVDGGYLLSGKIQLYN